MGRVRKPGAKRSLARELGGPGGAVWESARRQVLRPGARCFHCGCKDPDQVEHRISWQQRPDLMYVPEWMGQPFLVPTHGHCPHCDIWCNNISAGNAAPRDELGRSLPFGEEFLAERRARAAASAGKRGKVPSSAAKPAKLAGIPARPSRAAVPRGDHRPAPPGAVGAEYDDAAGHVVWCCDMPAMSRGRVTDATPGAGCAMLHWHARGDPGRCW
jgi:hypothetical protein